MLAFLFPYILSYRISLHCQSIWHGYLLRKISEGGAVDGWFDIERLSSSSHKASKWHALPPMLSRLVSEQHHWAIHLMRVFGKCEVITFHADSSTCLQRI